MSHALGTMLEAPRPLTQASFFEWVQEREGAGDINHYELLAGEIVVTPPAGYPHGTVGHRIGLVVGNFVTRRSLGVVFDSTQGFELPTGDTLEPDLSFVSTARWKAGPKPEVGKFLRIVPDLVVEILSPKTASRDRTAKRSAYERAGVREYWLVDPRQCEVVQLVRKSRTFGSETVRKDTLTSLVLRGLVVDVAALFAEP
jgi:Uma2 family endonuclease